MNPHSLGAAVRRLRSALAATGGSDAALLDRFTATRDPVAFAALVARYGPVVLGVCRRTVGDPHLAEDLFQAVFLVLGRKAGTIRKRDAVGSWLYGVAYRLSRKARSRLPFAPVNAGRAIDGSQRARNINSVDDPAATAAWNDLLAALDAELHRLPDRLRAPLLLCYYEGCTQDEAAARLGWSFGTLRRRLDQARDLLRVRLTARGATLGAGLLATVLATRGATAAVPMNLTQSTVDTAGTFAAGGLIVGRVGDLAEEGFRMFGASKVRASVALAMLVGGLAVGTGALLGVGRDEPPAKTETPVARAPGSPNPLPAGVVLRHGDPVFRHGGPILNVLVASDEKTILTQGHRAVRIWHAVTGQEQGAVDLPDDGPDFWTAALTAGGKTLITTRRDGTAQVWDRATRKLERSFPMAAPPFDVTGDAKCVHSPDGRMIAVVTADGSIRVCDVTAGKEMEQLRSHSDQVTAATFSPDGKRLILASGRGKLLDWNASTGEADASRFMEVSGVGNMRFSADGRLLAVAHSAPDPPRTAVLIFEWGSQNGAQELGGNPLAGRLMAFTPDGAYLLAPDGRTPGRILMQWNLRNNRAVRQYPEHREPIQALAFMSDGQTLIAADTALRFWDWKAGREVRPAADRGGERCYALTPDGKAVAEGNTSGAARLWDAATGTEVRRFEVPRPTNAVTWLNAIAVSPDGKLLAAQGGAGTPSTGGGADRPYVWVWRIADGELLHQLDDRAGGGVNRLTFSPDGRLLVSTSVQRPAVFWEPTTGAEVHDPNLQNLQTTRVVFRSDGQSAVSWDGSQRVGVFNGQRGDRGVVFNVIDDRKVRQVTAFAATPDASRVAVAGGLHDGTGVIGVADPTTLMVVGRVRPLPRPVSQLALTADGKIVAAALEGENPPVLVFDVATGKEVKRFTGLRGGAAWLAFAPDGKRLFAASSDTTVLAWDTSVVR